MFTGVENCARTTPMLLQGKDSPGDDNLPDGQRLLQTSHKTESSRATSVCSRAWRTARERRPCSCKEKIALGTIICRMANDFFKLRIKRNRVERHLYVHGRGELRANAAHALARKR